MKNCPIEINTVCKTDCLNFMHQMKNESVDLIVTDPPYNDLTMFRSGIKNSQMLGGHGWMKNDQIPEERFNIFFLAVLDEMKRILKPHGHIYIFCNHKVYCRFKEMFVQHFNFINMLVWDKQLMGLGWTYRNQHELILLGSKGKNKTKIMNKGNVLNFKRAVNNLNKHPTQKPENIISELIQNSSQKGDLVFDPFMGSGTTAVSAKKLGRNFIGCEIEERYVQMANLRLQALNIDINDNLSLDEVQNG